MKSGLVGVGVVAALVVSSAAGAGAPDYVWRRPAFYEPYVGRFASASGMVGVADLGSCYVVRTSDGFLVKALAINGFYCGAVSFSPDGRFLALSGAAYLGSLRIEVYEIADWTRVAFFTGSDGTGEAIFSPDGRYLLESGAGFYTPVYDVATWTLQRSLPGQAPSVSPDSRLVALASRTGSPSIHLFRLEDGTEVTPPSGYPHAGYHLLGNDWIALAANDEIRIETLTEPPQVIAMLSAPQIFRLVISPDAQILAGVVGDGKGGRLLQLWETKGFSSLRSWRISPNNSAAVAFASNDSIVSSNSTGDDARVDLWRVSDGTLLQPLNTDKGIYTALVYSPDGSAVVGGFGPNGNIRAWRASDGEYVQMIAGSGRLTSLSFTQDGQYLVGGGDRVSVWSWPDGNLVQSVSESAQDIAVSARGDLAQRTANEIRLRTLPDLMPLRTISQGGPISFSPDGNLIMVDADLFEVDTGSRLRTFPNGPFRNSVFSPDGMNVVASRGGRIDRFDVTSGDLVAEFGLRDASWINSLSLSPDGTRLAAFSAYATFRSVVLNLDIWDGYGSLYEDYNADLGLNGGRAN
ncbi:MAG TPA: WD40 repeat domain-containing protein, partial [Myxococcaceae bacterium]|nr:WD40 repeat domain-containing protein [Myxococcaceae bacterium]